MTSRRSLPALALLLLFTGLSAPAAWPRHPAQSASLTGQLIRVADRAVSMGEAISRVRQQTGGRVLDAKDQGNYYRVKVLTPEGEVRVFRVDARTGAIR